ncbi:MAG TPA: SRPBCC family protein [Cyclobacteriaceae bacterium]|jgi:ligand-binding SRPBCC domain-containing protein|nr:SRPBCC family protein [Cyclobacteriaceae bacterium]
MKIYHIKRKQTLPIGVEEAWDFFSSPSNLTKITPAKMDIHVLYISGGDKTYAGQIIHYKLKILSIFKIHWTTEITHVREPHYFVDIQLAGPYALWHHQHHFREIENGVEMIDELNYAIPFGLLGRLVNWLFVAREVNAIFDHRFTVLKRYFLKAKLQKDLI